MSQEWIPEWRRSLAEQLASGWSEEARARATQAILQPLMTGDEPAPETPPTRAEAPPVSPHGEALVELAGLGHDFAFELEAASSDNPEIQARIDALREDHARWLDQRRQALEALMAAARELESLQRRVSAEASIGRGGSEAVKLRLERWV